MSRASDSHRRAVADRKSVEAEIGFRWKDMVRRAINDQVLGIVEQEEQHYLNRLYELDEVHRKARDRLQILKSGPLRR